LNGYSNTAVLILRESLLNNRLDANTLKLGDFERLFDYETDLDDPNATVLNFCVKGLDKYEEYNKYNDIQIDFNALYKRYESERRKTRIVFLNIPKRAFIAVVAVIVSFSLATVVAAAMGYNLVDLIRNALNMPDKSETDYNGKGVIWTGDTRVYNSLEDMIESENLNIFYPESLPNGYDFTNFEITDKGNYLQLRLYADEPYISFRVQIGVTPEIDSYEYETNGIKYNIGALEDGLYQAQWSDGKDYYMIVVGDKAVLSEIIKNLKES